MTIGFIPNRERDKNLSVTFNLMEFTKAKGCRALLCDSNNIDCENVDFFVVLGGDGTMLDTAIRISYEDNPKPLLGINLGTLGYLTDAEVADSVNALKKAIDGDYVLEKRMMLELSVGEKLFYGLNEVCLKNSTASKIADVRIEINGEYIDTYRCDGIIVCTPTGSTAYNLSAGGPILKPDSDMIAVTPICPHMLYARSLVISGKDCVVLQSGCPELFVAVDGKTVCEISNGNLVYVKRAKRNTIIMKTNNLGFYDILRSKMIGADHVTLADSRKNG